MLKFEFLKERPNFEIIELLIVVGEYVDEHSHLYYLPTDYWSPKKYAENWLKSIEQLFTNGVTSFNILAYDISDTPHEEIGIDCYSAWKVGNDLYQFQSNSIMGYYIEEKIDQECLWKFTVKEPIGEEYEGPQIIITKDEIIELQEYLVKYLTTEQV